MTNFPKMWLSLVKACPEIEELLEWWKRHSDGCFSAS